MKTRFSTVDIVAMVNELQKCIGMRVNQVYDVDNKTYLFRLNRYEEKVVLLMESGMRIHTTEFEWPKNPSPSGFSMKLRKHIKNKRLESVNQLGVDRIIDLQFGMNEAAYHVFLELYDRGNIVLTDYEYMILNILRPRSMGDEDVKLVVREKYPIEKAGSKKDTYNKDEVSAALNNAKESDSLKKILMPLAAFGPALLDHVFLKNGFLKNCLVGKHFNVSTDTNRLFDCLDEADLLMKKIGTKSDGYVIQKVEGKDKDGNEIIANVEFHPHLFYQFKDSLHKQYQSFDKAIDDYFSNMEGQKIDLKAFQKEKEALKKLENVKKDHEQRLVKLAESQEENIKKAQLIEANLELVDKALVIIRSAIANQISWSDIQDLVKEAQIDGDPVAKAIKKLKLDINHFTLLLSNPYFGSDDEDEAGKPQLIDIDIDCSAYGNARKYYDMKRSHAKKEQKTIESSEKAFKNAEKKTKQALKEVAITTSITKARKVMWFEKFLWFISSENYLIIAGRDVQQNELIVKRYMKTNDLYVHADLHGASSLVIKNPTNAPVPPKTLNEAGVMAVCNSSAWDAKVVTSAWWVHAHQVSKTAPSGEYLITGSFMIRGKKNYLAPAHLIMGFGFMFKLDEESFQNHVNERCKKSDESLDVYEEEEAKNEAEKNEDVAENPQSESESEGSESDESSTNDVEGKVLEDILEAVNEDASKDDEDVSKDDEEETTPEESMSFPDTEIKLDVMSAARKSECPKKGAVKIKGETVVIKQHKKTPKNTDDAEKSAQAEKAPKDKQAAPKRGHRGKLKKMKEKYKDQDEEERELKMKILASAGQAKQDKKGNKKSKDTGPRPKLNKQKQPQKTVHFVEAATENEQDVSAEKTEEKVPAENVAEAAISDEEDEDTQTSDELQMLNSLTGLPIPDDTLMYAIPVCAPYSTMLPYKYKVKIIPGSSRRGKAAKTALQIFLHEKSATQREKDLLRNVKDQDISRNLPGKIKISTASYKKGK